jgi:hypothetical protein
MEFDFWQRWGAGLDEVSFANAWVAIGLDYHWGSRFPDLYLREGGGYYYWDFPRERGPVYGTPEQWARAWVNASSQIQTKPVRLWVDGAPPDEPILPWYRLLSKAIPPPGAVALRIESPRAQLHINWPLRLACMLDNARNVIEQTAKMYPSSKIVQGVRLGREQTNCDILVYKGSARSLLQELLQSPYTLKANIIILQGGDEAAWGETDALLTSILAQMRASGYILVPRSIGDEQLAKTINKMVREISHAHPVDIALSESIRHINPGDVVAGFTQEIMEFAVFQLVERYNERIATLPPGTTLDLSQVGDSQEWLTYGVNGGGITGGTSKGIAPPEADRQVESKSVSIEADKLSFEHEDQGSTVLAEMGEAITTASVPVETMTARAARFLQQRSFVQVEKKFREEVKSEYPEVVERESREVVERKFREAKNGFIAGVPAMVRVRIAAPKEGWNSLPEAFPVEKLPEHQASWTLTVWLSEPDHLPSPIKGQIELPRDGDSTECEFHFRPQTHERFNGRLTVLHRGRIIQTAVLRAAVVTTSESSVITTSESPEKGGAPRLEEFAAIRRHLGDLDERRRYDVTFVANHDEKGRPLLTALSDKAAWVKDLSPVDDIAREINNSLIPVAMSVKDYAKGLNCDKGRELLIQLAQHGGWLKDWIDTQLNGTGNNPVTAEAEFLQIVSTRSNAVVPLEFVYDYGVPEDGAEVCKHWLKASKKDEDLHECPDADDHRSGRSVCPMGFWGLRKVIERHAVDPGLARDGNVLYLQSEPSRESSTLHLGGVAVLGSSQNVPKRNVTKLQKLMQRCCGVEPKLAKDWDEWEKHVQEHHPSLLVALPHTDGRATNVTLEIGGKAIKTITLRNTHVFPPPVEGRQTPLVALLGCDVVGTADEYGNHVLVLRARGAGIVIGTIATVFGEHAAQVAEKLVEGMLVRSDDKPVRLGELIRTIRRNSLRDGLFMPLCLVAYGDADWILSPGRANDV